MTKHLSKMGNMPTYAKFRRFGQKGAQCYSIRIVRPDLESSHYLVFPGTPFDMIFTYIIFTSVLLFDHKLGQEHHFLDNTHSDELIVISVKKCIR